ncbi:GntR family transcriptional regulator [Clostridium sp. CCUG 7971]|uniref:GntR family transcriptional regulator n=1 Tax=Clostridium sp. CCUG 7971 TaxID=2811414 RepID=UPI001ABB52D7|nr:GntR family transcriptional regulator [Clostridium sp. CCUG 7971]MBO3446505.1 GntR family transcriptional regulator [Clostridium sp. CCUG 7971]
MKFELDNKSPIYLQIIKYIKQQIVIGELNPGDTVPSRREMALELNVNLNTVQRAYKEMGDMGIINTFKNYQSNITTDENILKNIKMELINESLEVFIENMKAIKVTKEEVIEIISEKY